MPTTIPQLSRLMKHLLTSTAERFASESGFVQRVSKLSGSLFARTLVFSWWADPAAPCSARADMATTLGCPISAQGFDQRFTLAAARFLQALLGAAVQQAVCADPVTIPVLRRFAHVEICDGSVIPLPASLAPTWPGCGPGTAALKLLLRWDLTTGRLYGPQLAAGHRHDQTVAQALPALPADSLFLGDLGFFSLRQFAAWAASGRWWLSRYRVALAVYTPTGQRLDGVQWLTAGGRAPVDAAVVLGAEDRLPARLLAERVPAAVLAERRRALREEAARRQRAVNPEAWELARWTILLTNCPAARLSAAEARALGEARWQVELLIKRFKSLGQVDEWQTARPARVLTEIYAQLLVQVLQHWLLVVGCWREPAKSLWRGVQALQRRGWSLARAWGKRQWEEELAEAAAAVGRGRIDRRRQQPATYQRLLAAAPPPAVNSFAA